MTDVDERKAFQELKSLESGGRGEIVALFVKHGIERHESLISDLALLFVRAGKGGRMARAMGQDLEKCIALITKIRDALDMNRNTDVLRIPDILRGKLKALSEGASAIPPDIREVLRDMIHYGEKGKVAEPSMVEAAQALLDDDLVGDLLPPETPR